MPHRLDRLQDDAEGTVTGVPDAIYFSFGPVDWEDRVVGDEDSNPDPSFVGEKIQAMFLDQNRLGFAFKANVCMSRTGDFFNPWKSSATRILDDDRLDFEVAVSRLANDQALNIRHVLNFAEELLLIGDRAQLVLPHTEALTSATVRVNLATSLEVDPDCPPVSVNNSAFLPTRPRCSPASANTSSLTPPRSRTATSSRPPSRG
jgi:hypothetical protein